MNVFTSEDVRAPGSYRLDLDDAGFCRLKETNKRNKEEF